ncbi:hypothetical protein ACEPAH_7136 [Sanghuangporus vaninii]
MTVFLTEKYAGGKHPSAHRRRPVNPNSRRAESARARNKNPCARCKRMRQKCTREGDRACSKCAEKNTICEPSKPESNLAPSIQTSPRFIFEDGQSRPTQGRYRSNTVQTIESVASPINEKNQENKIFSPTSPTVQFPWAYESASQSPTAELRSIFRTLAFDESEPLEDERASASSPHVGNGISQGQLLGSEGQTIQSTDSSLMFCNSASSSILPQMNATSEVVATTSASVSISGDTTNLDASTFSCSREYVQEAGGSTHGSMSVIVEQDNTWHPPSALDGLETFGVNLSFPLDPVSLDEGLFTGLGSISGQPTGLDHSPLQSEHESANAVEQDYDEYRVQQEGYLQLLQLICFLDVY